MLFRSDSLGKGYCHCTGAGCHIQYPGARSGFDIAHQPVCSKGEETCGRAVLNRRKRIEYLLHVLFVNFRLLVHTGFCSESIQLLTKTVAITVAEFIQCEAVILGAMLFNLDSAH